MKFKYIATDCMLGCQPNHGWQLCFPLYVHAVGSGFRLYGRTDYLFDINYTVSSQSNAKIIYMYISRSKILLKYLNQVVLLIL